MDLVVSCAYHPQLHIESMDTTGLEKEEANYWNFLAAMGETVDEEGLMEELATGFRLLADARTGTITVASLRHQGWCLGMPPLSDAQLLAMIQLGDPSGKGHLDLHQFCVAILRFSPALLQHALCVLLSDEEGPHIAHASGLYIKTFFTIKFVNFPSTIVVYFLQVFPSSISVFQLAS